MKTKRFIIAGLLIAGMPAAYSQTGMRQWRTHFKYNSVTQVELVGNKVFALSDGSLFSVDKVDDSLEFYTKMNGLNSSGISKIKSIPSRNELIIAYENGNIDILTSGGVFNISDLYNKSMTVSKHINGIYIHNDKAYLSCDFGILVMNLDKKEIAETYYIGDNSSAVKVLNIAINNERIFALAEENIYTADINNPNLVDFRNWTKLGNLPGGGAMQAIDVFANQLLVCRNYILYRSVDHVNWTSQANAKNIRADGDRLFLFNDSAPVVVFDRDFSVINTVENIGVVSDALYINDDDNYWFAANVEGIKVYRDGSISSYLPNGPAANAGWDMAFSGEKLFVVPGARWFSGENMKGNIMMYEEDVWTNITTDDIVSELGFVPYDFTNIAVDPADNTRFFVTTYCCGLLEFRQNAFYRRFSGGEIETAWPGALPDRYTYTDGAVFDANGNLFFINPQAKKTIKILDNHSNLTGLDYTETVDNSIFGKILIPSKQPNQKWVPFTRTNPGLFIYDDQGSLFTASAKKVFITAFPDQDNVGAFFTPSHFYCAVEDKDGTIWVGTDSGPFLFHGIMRVFDEDYSASRVKIPRNDGTSYADYLLENERIRSIAVDGANRKWIGTEETGVYLLSENGLKTIHHFTMENSPLPSNSVTSIAINPVSGEVFFGTRSGIVSFKSDAAEGGRVFDNVYAYPNPVRETYTGIITITGLVKDTNVKITDLNGNLVCETVSNGSLATWDGKDKFGRKVSTGVYLAICVAPNKEESTTTKILVIN
ncbi:MAG: T9SS type A sorting domain-containing protein [Prevotellaceae bacterium]|jgi:hypothetical protein|nr:T9SS type A sorting domain-containing protein [Prevotellaceae bacterium]